MEIGRQVEQTEVNFADKNINKLYDLSSFSIII